MTSLVTCWGLRVVGEYIAGQEVKDSTSLRQLRPSGANWKPFGHKQDVLADFEVN